MLVKDLTKIFFMLVKMLPFLFLFAYMYFELFLRVKSSRKKIKTFGVVWMASFTLLLMCTPINPPIVNLFVRTYFYLSESFFFMIHCKNPFFINLLQHFAITSKHKLKIWILLQEAITLTYSLSVHTYFHFYFIIQNLFSFACINFDQQELKIFFNINNY